MEKMDRDEKLWGGIFGVIAILATIIEMFINGLNASSIVGAVKDISGTFVVVVLLAAFIKSLPKKPKKLPQILEKAVEDWGTDNAPLIFKTQEFVCAQNSTATQGFVLLQDPKKYVDLVNENLNKDSVEWIKYAKYRSGYKLTGKFLDFPSYETMTKDNFIVTVVLEQNHFKKIEGFSKIMKGIKNAINSRFSEIAMASHKEDSLSITINYKKITTIEDVEKFVDSLDFILSLVKVVS